MKNNIAKPFVKWAGGKTQLLNEIDKALPSNFADVEGVTYVEPFVGGGAVLFWILKKYPNIQRAIINDINPRLITTYRVIKDEPHALISLLKEFQAAYNPLSEEERKCYFLKQRETYNFSHLTDMEIAARFIFLNRTCFNGLYRENSKGHFNVPHGRYANPKICDEATILADSELLQKVEIYCGDFAEMARFASPKTLFYFDPPYKPLSETSSFNSYVKEEFDDAEQIRLGEFCHQIASLKASFLLSNSDLKGKNPDDDFFDKLYEKYEIHRVMASRMVNANASKRGKLSELLVRNVLIKKSSPKPYSQIESNTLIVAEDECTY